MTQEIPLHRGKPEPAANQAAFPAVSEALERELEAPLRRFRPYPEYKDSGVEWLGEIPAHWRVKPLKHACTKWGLYGANESAETYTSQGVRFLRTTDIDDRGELVEERSVFVDEALVTDYLLSTGDFLLSRSGTLGRALHYRSARHGKCAYAGYLVRFVPTAELDSQFAFYFTKSAPFQQWLATTAIQSTIGNINGKKYGSLPLPLPERAHQRSIASFLDEVTKKLETLITKKKQLIRLLRERRFALINQAVTQGLDSNAPMKDSGVEWLGQIPAHWEVTKIKAVSSLQTGITLGKRYESAKLEARPYLRVANVQAGYLNLDDITEIELPYGEAKKYELQPGDVVVTEGGDFDKLGRGHVWEGQVHGCLHQNHIFVVRTQQRTLSPYFLAAVMESGYGRAYFTATSTQATNLASTNSTKLRNFSLPLPGLSEQVEILDFVSSEDLKMNRLVKSISDAVGRLKEYRIALISAAVTGKIDVRGEVA
jgi:type I restriction enzyme, S subunit